MQIIKVGIIGCGNISSIYIENLSNMFKGVKLVACADIDLSRAQAKAEQLNDDGKVKYPDLKAMTVDELLADPEIQIVVNLTIPVAHHEVAKKAILAGKCCYNEKPLCLSRDQAQELVKLADENKVLVGGAPDTFMGAGIQTCAKIINDGWIGKPISATAFMCCPGHESWHPAPEFYYLPGGGPMFDMGPYYLTALVNLLGPVAKVAGLTARAKEERVCTSELRKGDVMPVDVQTHVTGLMQFASGATGTIITSFDVWKHTLPCIEIHGTQGSLSVPDPNCFGGPVKLCVQRSDFKEMPLSHSYADNSRGLGVADMARALRDGDAFRANGQLASHVLELMHAFHDSSDSGQFVNIQSVCDQPKPMPSGMYVL
ncbi:MAG TPA: oxidoreductase [Phycisphaerales bacterium]|nr:oxidoreductase [Phycisphaerales bacterium]|tara:strand:- start:1561 stop:2676 length:1116 start_codon:yes stop_codon:yes gene_type:complete